MIVLAASTASFIGRDPGPVRRLTVAIPYGCGEGGRPGGGQLKEKVVGAAALSSFSGRCSRVARQQWGVGPSAARVDARKAAHFEETAVEVVPGPSSTSR